MALCVPVATVQVPQALVGACPDSHASNILCRCHSNTVYYYRLYMCVVGRSSVTTDGNS